jgi:tetratricopeptide (TPR) repeat protein
MKSVCYFLFLLFFSVITLANEKDSVLIRAQEYYALGEFSKAIEQYKSLSEISWISADLYYNIGNSYFRNNDIKSAILYYERARRLSPNNEAINENLALARSLIFDRVEALPEPFFMKMSSTVRDLFSARTWAALSISTFIAALMFTLIFLFLRKIQIRKLAFGLSICCIVLSMTTFCLSYFQKKNVERTDEAIVFVPSVILKSSPTDSGNNLIVIHEGLKVQIVDQIGDWYEVRIANGNKGWMRVNDLRII